MSGRVDRSDVPAFPEFGEAAHLKNAGIENQIKGLILLGHQFLKKPANPESVAKAKQCFESARHMFSENMSVLEGLNTNERMAFGQSLSHLQDKLMTIDETSSSLKRTAQKGMSLYGLNLGRTGFIPTKSKPEISYSVLVTALNLGLNQAKNAADEPAGSSKRNDHLKAAESMLGKVKASLESVRRSDPTERSVEKTILLMARLEHQIHVLKSEQPVKEVPKKEQVKEFFVRAYGAIFSNEVGVAGDTLSELKKETEVLSRNVRNLHKDFYIEGSQVFLLATKENLRIAEEKLGGIPSNGLPGSYLRRKERLLSGLAALKASVESLEAAQAKGGTFSVDPKSIQKLGVKQLAEGYKEIEALSKEADLPPAARARVDLGLKLYRDQFEALKANALKANEGAKSINKPFFEMAKVSFLVFDKDQISAERFGKAMAQAHLGPMSYDNDRKELNKFLNKDETKEVVVLYQAAYASELKVSLREAAAPIRESYLQRLVYLSKNDQISLPEIESLQDAISTAAPPIGISGLIYRKTTLLGATGKLQESPLTVMKEIREIKTSQWKSFTEDAALRLGEALVKRMDTFQGTSSELEEFQSVLKQFEESGWGEKIGKSAFNEITEKFNQIVANHFFIQVDFITNSTVDEAMPFADILNKFEGMEDLKARIAERRAEIEALEPLMKLLKPELVTTAPGGKSWTRESIRDLIGLKKSGDSQHRIRATVTENLLRKTVFGKVADSGTKNPAKAGSEKVREEVAELLNGKRQMLSDKVFADLVDYEKTIAQGPGRADDRALVLEILKKGIPDGTSGNIRYVNTVYPQFKRKQAEAWLEAHPLATEAQKAALEPYLEKSNKMLVKTREFISQSAGGLPVPEFVTRERSPRTQLEEVIASEAKFIEDAIFLYSDLSNVDESKLSGSQKELLLEYREKIKSVVSSQSDLFKFVNSTNDVLPYLMSKPFLELLKGDFLNLIRIADEVNADPKIMKELENTTQRIKLKEDLRELNSLSETSLIFVQRFMRYETLLNDAKKTEIDAYIDGNKGRLSDEEIIELKAAREKGPIPEKAMGEKLQNIVAAREQIKTIIDSYNEELRGTESTAENA